MQQLSSAPRPITNPEVLIFGLRVTGIGQSIAGQRIPSDCIMIGNALRQHISNRLPGSTVTEFITALGLLATEHGLETRMAIDCFMYPEDTTTRTLEQIKTLRKLGRHQEAAELARSLE